MQSKHVVAGTGMVNVSLGTAQANARLIAEAPAMRIYMECEEARTRGEDIAETVLKRYGFDPANGTPHEFMDKMRRAILARIDGGAK